MIGNESIFSRRDAWCKGTQSGLEPTSRHVALWGMCYIHVNNIHYAVIVIFKQKIKLFKNGNPTRKIGGNMLGHISKGKQEDESNR